MITKAEASAKLAALKAASFAPEVLKDGTEEQMALNDPLKMVHRSTNGVVFSRAFDEAVSHHVGVAVLTEGKIVA